MGEVKEMNGKLSPVQQAIAEKAAAETLAQLNAQNEAARPDQLVFTCLKEGGWVWHKVSARGDSIGQSAIRFQSFKMALANYNRVCSQKVDLDVRVQAEDPDISELVGLVTEPISVEPDAPGPVAA